MHSDMINGDRTIAPLLKAILVICLFLTFGMILSNVVSRKDEALLDREHKTSIRISLVREEYERKMGDLRLKYRQACEQKVQEIINTLKQRAKETLGKQRAEFEDKYRHELKNQSSEIKRLKEDLEKLIKADLQDLQQDDQSKRKVAVGEIEKQLTGLETKILQLENSKTKQSSISRAEAELFTEDDDFLADVAGQLDEMEKGMDIT